MDWRESRAGKRWLALYGHRKKVRMTWLARARLLSGQSVVQAAKACGLSPRTWEAWEQGRSEPPVSALRAMLSHFGAVPIAGPSRLTVNPATLEVL